MTIEDVPYPMPHANDGFILMYIFLIYDLDAGISNPCHQTCLKPSPCIIPTKAEEENIHPAIISS